MIRTSSQVASVVLGSSGSRTARTASLVSLLVLAACGGPEPKSSQALADDGVPANSASEARLGNASDDKDAKKEKAKEKDKEASGAAKADPTQPYMTSLNTDGDGASSGGGPGAPNAPNAPAGTKKATGKVTKQECSQLFDKYVDLTIRTDSRFEGIPPEMIATLKSQGLAQAAQQKGDPCAKEEVSRAKFDCAMAATHPKAWEKCMK